MPKMIFAIAAAALSTSAVMFSPAAFAADAKVTWADLDLSTDAGQAALTQRIAVAARKVCPSDKPVGTLISRQSTHECRSQVTSKIAARVGEMTEDTRLGG